MHSSGQHSWLQMHRSSSVLQSEDSNLMSNNSNQIWPCILRVKARLPGLSQFQILVPSLGYSYYNILLRLEYLSDSFTKCRKVALFMITAFVQRRQLRNRSMEEMHREGSSAKLPSFLLFHLCLPGTKGTQKSSGAPCYLSSNLMYSRCSHHWQHWVAWQRNWGLRSRFIEDAYSPPPPVT